MADLSKVGTTTMELLDDLAEEVDEGQEVTDILLIVHTRNQESGHESLHSRCSTNSYLIQQGLIAWVKAIWDTAAADEEDDD
jgi:hypothetical protein